MSTTWEGGYDAATWSADGSTVDELAEEDGPVLMWCSSCRTMTWADWLREYEGDPDDMYWARCCTSCGSWCQEGDEPEELWCCGCQAMVQWVLHDDTPVCPACGAEVDGADPPA